MTTFWETVAHLVNRTCLFVSLVIARIGSEGRIWVLIVPIPGHCLRFTFKVIFSFGKYGIFAIFNK